MPAPHAQSPDGRQAQQEVTDALVALRDGAPDALDRVLPLVYDELRKVAHRQLGAERASHTFSTTALVHEAYLKLVDQTRAQWSDRAQFFAVAARAMRRILVDYARRHRALRRGGAQRPVPLEALEEGDLGAMAAAERADELVALDEALERLAALDERLSRVVECRFFAGLTEAETAEVLGVTARTVARDWVKARGWLYQELRPDVA
jgi:RNA polymerase sigma factor (TIGR02999 family)